MNHVGSKYNVPLQKKKNVFQLMVQTLSKHSCVNYAPTLYFRALPELTYILKNNAAKVCNTSEEWLTVMCCASMNGEKKELLFIGKSHKPRCFKGVKMLPVQYKANKNAWMMATLFEEWLVRWDQDLKRNILVLVDNCPAHVLNLKLKFQEIFRKNKNTYKILKNNLITHWKKFIKLRRNLGKLR